MIKITSSLLKDITKQAKSSLRLRKNYNFHKDESDKLQRMLNALEPGTYVRPHKHINPSKREIFILLKGKLLIAEFDENGEIADHIMLDTMLGNYAAEIPPNVWHTVISLESGSVYYEIKDGPYDPDTDKVFAEWSPEEGSDQVSVYLDSIINSLA